MRGSPPSSSRNAQPDVPSDRYTIPGTDGVLRNRRGLLTVEGVNHVMNMSASLAWADLISEPIPQFLDLEYLRSIHFRFFDPVLDWAGQLRAVGDEVGAGGTPFQYAASQFYKRELDALMDRLAGEDYLRGLSIDEFATALADRWGTLTFTHPFRDGNTRSQSAYVDRLAVRAGFQIDWKAVSYRDLRDARLAAAFKVGGERVLADYLRPRMYALSQYPDHEALADGLRAATLAELTFGSRTAANPHQNSSGDTSTSCPATRIREHGSRHIL